MPDRDIFTTLSPPLRGAAQSLVRTACGKEPELLPIAEGLNHLLDGGVASLHMTLRCLASQAGDERQAWFEDFAHIHRSALSRVREQYGKDWKDELLCQEAIRACGLGIRDEQYVLRCFVMSAINSAIIEARGGVAERLNKRGIQLDVQELESHLAQLIDTTAALMVRNPNFKRLGLASKFRSEVDLYGENLL
ncbi:hypothetical protein BO221_45050 [Archangium sp. Cb G35]|uniref:hypothetical protein n=1 Tax=Archangium sp. Cb G35 TaxID=1920190 RepID=UPI000935E18B|nr:hypothetical protein [Archangium sp. Cb G35]OJT17296.1 hypothetical protein BO221_45050 [Archangium sp. Cb G35]